MNDCIHHWLIPTVKGLAATCKKCGAERIFSNEPHPDRIDLMTVRDATPRSGRLTSGFRSGLRRFDGKYLDARQPEQDKEVGLEEASLDSTWKNDEPAGSSLKRNPRFRKQ